jgi:hypothetical protein
MRAIERTQQMGQAFDAVDDAETFEPPCADGAEHLPEGLDDDNDRDGDDLCPGEDEDTGFAEAHEDEPPLDCLRLRDVLGSRPPRVLFRLVEIEDGVCAELVVRPKPEVADAVADALVELAAFIAERFAAGKVALDPEQWARLMGRTPAPPAERLLLLSWLAIRGNTKLTVPGAGKYAPNDRGLSGYASKFAALPDGAPFSLRWLIEDGRGKARVVERSTKLIFLDLPLPLQLQALRLALDAEAQSGEARTDDEFREPLREAAKRLLAGSGFEIRTPTTAHVTELREKLKRNGLGHHFPKSQQRKKLYANRAPAEKPS